MGISIEIAVSCTWFQRRLCWMLSSVLQQVGKVPDITFSVAYPKNNGSPTTEEVCDFFMSKGLKMRQAVYPDMNEIQYRGLVRNRQLQESNSDWILFADTDMTYDAHFFEDLAIKLEGPLKNETRVISASRVSLDKDYCKKYFNELDKHVYPCVVEKSGELGSWPVFQISRNCGAGYFQLVNRKNVMDNCGGLYVDPAECQDWSWFGKGQKANSDKQFRSRVGGIKRISTLPQFHLNHERDNEAGTHLTNQR